VTVAALDRGRGDLEHAKITAMGRGGNGEARVSASAGVPLHRQLYLVLHDEIARGAVGPGEALPTEQSLCNQFGVSRITVRRALADLAEAGLIKRRHGVGSFVADNATARAHDPTASYMDGLRQIEFETEVEVLEFGVRAAPAAVSERLGGQHRLLQVLRLRRERITREPCMVTELWLPEHLAETLTEPALAGAPLYQLLYGAGVGIDGVDHELTAEVAGPRIATLLDTAIGTAVIRVNSVAHAAGKPHHFLSIALSPNRSRVLLSQSAADFESGIGMAIAHDVRRPRV
jgi:GntR family transcriptional regulator